MSGRAILCACCGKLGPHYARNLLEGCYRRHQWAGTLDKFPPAGNPLAGQNPWNPTSPKGLGKVEDYEFLIENGVTDPEALAERLGCTLRHVARIASASRARRSVQLADAS